MEPTRIDLGLRIVVDVPDYRTAGILMDDIHGAIGALLNSNEVQGKFDFTHFQTRPCKAQRMEAVSMEIPGAVLYDGTPEGM